MYYDYNSGFYVAQTPMGGQIYAMPLSATVNVQQNFSNVQHLFDNREKYLFKKPTEKMNWRLAEAIDADKIEKEGDITKIKFFIEEFKNSQIDKSDKKHFQSEEVYNAFKVMQLGLSYLSAENDKIANKLDNQNVQGSQNDVFLIQMREKCADKEREIEDRDELIEKLKMRIEELESAKKDDERKITILRRKLHHTRQLNTQLRTRLEDTEEGLAHTATMRRRYTSLRRRMKNDT